LFVDPWLIKLRIVVEVKGGSHECDSLLLMFSVGNTLLLVISRMECYLSLSITVSTFFFF